MKRDAPELTYVESLARYELSTGEGKSSTADILVKGAWLFDYMSECMNLFVTMR